MDLLKLNSAYLASFKKINVLLTATLLNKVKLKCYNKLGIVLQVT